MHIILRSILSLTSFALLPSIAFGAQLNNGSKTAIPKDVQQLIVIDYRAMQNSPAAMSLKDRILPPELKRLETALKTSGLKVDREADVLAFVLYRGEDGTRTVGIAQGQFQTRAVSATFAKSGVKPVMVRNNSVYPMGSGNVVAFVNQTTMVFGDKDAVGGALDARDGIAPNFLSNGELTDEMGSVDRFAVWSVLDQKGTRIMMRSVLGEAAQLADYDTVKNRFKTSRYTMDFQNGVRFEMSVLMSDTVTAATVATLMQGVALFKKNTGSPMEKSALDQMTIDSSSGTLAVRYSSSDRQFASLLGSSLFQQVVR